jgi:CHASE2 domain-containing sensor protein
VERQLRELLAMLTAITAGAVLSFILFVTVPGFPPMFGLIPPLAGLVTAAVLISLEERSKA